VPAPARERSWPERARGRAAFLSAIAGGAAFWIRWPRGAGSECNGPPVLRAFWCSEQSGAGAESYSTPLRAGTNSRIAKQRLADALGAGFSGKSPKDLRR
jgi:hypothetical protein